MIRTLFFLLKTGFIAVALIFVILFGAGVMYANAATEYAQTHDMTIPVSVDALKEIDPAALVEYVRGLNPDLVDQVGSVNLEGLTGYLLDIDPYMSMDDVEEMMESR